MEHPRYGKLKFQDFTIFWWLLAGCVFFAIGLVYVDELFLVPVPIIWAIVLIWAIISPNIESFSVSNEYITARKGNQSKNILLPEEILIILAHADISPPLTVATALRNPTNMLKGKYSFSVLQGMTAKEAINQIHKSYVRIYKTSVIRGSIDEFYYLYDFVCSETVIKEIIMKRRCQIVIPASIWEHLPFILPDDVEVFVDTNY